MIDKTLTRQEKIELVKAVLGISFLIVGIRVAFIFFSIGLDSTIERWPIELAFLLLIIILVSLTVILGVYVDRHFKGSDTSKDDTNSR